MNKDRIEGSAERAKGKVKEVAGKVTGDSKLEAEGKTEQVAGKVQNTVGGIKDAVEESVDDWRLPAGLKLKSPGTPGLFAK